MTSGDFCFSCASGENEKVSLNFFAGVQNIPDQASYVVFTGQGLQDDSLSKLNPNWGVLNSSADLLLKNKLKQGVYTSENGQMFPLFVLPITKEASRHNSPSRPDLLAKSLGGPVTEFLSSDVLNLEIVVFLISSCHASATARCIAKLFPRYSQKSSLSKKQTVRVSLVAPESLSDTDILEVSSIAHYVRFSQALVDLPPNLLGTRALAEVAKREAQKFPCVQVVNELVGDTLSENGFGGIWAVGKGANEANHPILLHLVSESSSATTPPIVLVGKGIIYDSGGLSLKPRDGMCGMKTDMGGAAGILGGFFAAISSCQQRGPVHLILCIAENCIGPTSYRNDDVITLLSGLTVEVNNTDAEGRLVLADGVAYAAQKIPSASVIVDMATLTGAQGVATGKVHGAVLSNTEFAERRVVEISRSVGDPAFPLLFCPELHAKLFESKVADFKNSVNDRFDAQSSAAGWFIYENLRRALLKNGNEEPVFPHWVHVDMSGPSVENGRGTGYGVALVSGIIKSGDWL